MDAEAGLWHETMVKEFIWMNFVTSEMVKQKKFVTLILIYLILMLFCLSDREV